MNRHITSAVPPGQTRDCLDPWRTVFLRAEGDVALCCWAGPVGNLREGSLASVLRNDKAKEIRRRLLAGDLDKDCAACPARGTTSTVQLRDRVSELVDDHARNELSHLRLHNATVEKELGSLRAHNATIEKELSSLRAHDATIQRERDALAGHMHTIEAELHELRPHAITLQDELAGLRPHAATILRERDALRGHVATIQSERDALAAHTRTVEQEIRALKGHLATIETELAALRSHTTTLEKQLESGFVGLWRRMTGPLKKALRGSRR